MNFWLLLVLLLSCRSGGNECNADKACGFGETCDNGYCVAYACNTSAECPMEHLCTPERVCAPGCATSSDCYPGSNCALETATCEAVSCTSTQADCGFREFCNYGTGECYDAGSRYCQYCSSSSECGEDSYCVRGACGVDCSGDKECPAGFSCFRIIDDDEVIAYQCGSQDCRLYEEYLQ